MYDMPLDMKIKLPLSKINTDPQAAHDVSADFSRVGIHAVEIVGTNHHMICDCAIEWVIENPIAIYLLGHYTGYILTALDKLIAKKAKDVYLQFRIRDKTVGRELPMENQEQALKEIEAALSELREQAVAENYIPTKDKIIYTKNKGAGYSGVKERKE